MGKEGCIGVMWMGDKAIRIGVPDGIVKSQKLSGEIMNETCFISFRSAAEAM